MIGARGLPFTHDQFLDVFASYNQGAGFLAPLLWLGTLGVLVSWARSRPGNDRMLYVLLAAHWTWSAIAYFVAYFRTLTPAAWLFAALFAVQAVLFARLARRPGGVAWTGSAPRRALAALVVAYGLAYPFLGLAMGLTYPRMPTFGVPCPTVLLTAGLLLLAAPRAPRRLVIVPLAWCAIGGSAAAVLGITVDIALPVAGVLLVLSQVFPVAARTSVPAGPPASRSLQAVPWFRRQH